MEQREADAVQHAADLTAEAERLARARQLEQGAAREQRIFDHKRVLTPSFLSEISAHENAIIANSEEEGGRPSSATTWCPSRSRRMPSTSTAH